MAKNPPTTAVNTEAQKRLEQIESENKELKARLERLEAISVERLVCEACAESMRRQVPRLWKPL